MKKYLILLFIIFSAVFTFWHFFERNTYFISIQIAKYSPIRSPCIDIQVGSLNALCEIDLGFQGNLSLEKDFADQIADKIFLSSGIHYGLRGKEYRTDIYRIPKAQIGEMAFIKPRAQIEHPEFHGDTVFVKEGSPSLNPAIGKIGWELFQDANLLLDFKNSKIAFCDSLNTLKKNGFSKHLFTTVPLLTDRGLVEFETTTPQGALRCMLDTGATWNFLNTPQEKPLEEVMWDPSAILEMQSLQIGNQDFGPVLFHCIPIKIPIFIEAILGMEFLFDHLVFIDFHNNQIHFAKQLEN